MSQNGLAHRVDLNCLTHMVEKAMKYFSYLFLASAARRGLEDTQSERLFQLRLQS